MSRSPRVTGSGDEVVVSLGRETDFNALCTELERLMARDDRLRQSPVLVLEVGDAALSQEQLVQLEEAVSRRLGPRLLQVVSHDFAADPEEAGVLADRNGRHDAAGLPGPPGAAAARGAAASPGRGSAPPAAAIADRPGPLTRSPAGEEDGGHFGAAGEREDPSPPAPAPEGPRLKRGGSVLVRRTLRSGHRLVYDGDVVIVGDVNPGAEVIATGDIVVFGRLRGTVHAGVRGDAGAIVASVRMEPVQVRIAGCIGRAPDREPGRSPGEGREPEVAFVRDGRVVIEPFDPARLDRRWWQRLPGAGGTV